MNLLLSHKSIEPCVIAIVLLGFFKRRKVKIRTIVAGVTCPVVEPDRNERIPELWAKQRFTLVAGLLYDAIPNQSSETTD